MKLTFFTISFVFNDCLKSASGQVEVSSHTWLSQHLQKLLLFAMQEMYEVRFWNDGMQILRSYFESESCNGKLHRSSPSFFGFRNNYNVTFWSLRRNWPLTLLPSKCCFTRQKAGTSSRNLWNQNKSGKQKKLEINKSLSSNLPLKAGHFFFQISLGRKGWSWALRWRWGVVVLDTASSGFTAGKKRKSPWMFLKERGRWNVKERYWRIFKKKKRYLIPHWMFFFMLFVILEVKDLRCS